MNAVDFFLLALLSIWAIRGYVRGLFREAMGVAGVVFGGAAAMAFWRPAAFMLNEIIAIRPLAAQIMAAILIYVVVNLLTHLAAIGLERIARAVFLSGVTRMAGALVGVGKGVVILAFALLFMRSYVPVSGVADAIDSSTIGAPLTRGASSAVRYGMNLMRSPEPRET